MQKLGFWTQVAIRIPGMPRTSAPEGQPHSATPNARPPNSQRTGVRRQPAASKLDPSSNAISNEIMAELMPSPPRSDTKPWLKHVGRSVLALGLLSICLLTGSVIILAVKIAPFIAPWFG